MRVVAMLGMAATVTSCSGTRDAKDAAGPLMASVKRGPMKITAKATGEIRAAKSNKIIPKLKRSGNITYLVPEGERVAAGEVVARFNTDDIEKGIIDLEASLADQRSKLDNAQSNLDIQRMDNETNLKIAQQNLNSAGMELKKHLRGDAPLDRRNAELKVKTTESEQARREKRLAEIRELLKEGFVTEDQVEEERIALEEARVAYRTAQVELSILNEYTLPLKKTQAENNLAKAETELEKARKSSDTLLRQKVQAVEAAKHAVERTQSELAKRREELDNCTIKTPAPGVATYGDPDRRWRRAEIQVGANFHPGQVLLTIPNTSNMQAVVNVPEADIHRIALDQPVTLTVEALAGETFSGRVKKVAEVASSQNWWRSGIKEFEVEISIDGAEI